MKRRVKPFTELSRWQRNRRLRQGIEEYIEQSFDLKEESCIDSVIQYEKEDIEMHQMENHSIPLQRTEFNNFLQDSSYSSDSNDCNKDLETETSFCFSEILWTMSNI